MLSTVLTTDLRFSALFTGGLFQLNLEYGIDGIFRLQIRTKLTE